MYYSIFVKNEKGEDNRKLEANKFKYYQNFVIYDSKVITTRNEKS